MSPSLAERWPGLRAALGGVLPLLLPVPWVLEVKGCDGHGEPQLRTGVDLLAELPPASVAVVVLGLALLVALPFLARGRSPGRAALLHLAGVADAALLLWLGWMVLFFTIFEERTLKPAGAAVMGLLGALGVDALVRAGLSARAWWRGRQGSRTADDTSQQR